MEPKHILFPVDFSVPCTDAAGYVEAMARGSGARLTLLHVLECPPSWYSDAEAARLSLLADVALMKEHRQEQLNLYLGRQFHHVAPLRLLAQGDPASEIAQFASREGVNLIMMPTRGSGVFRRLLLGSVTAKVLHDARCPVWTSSHSERVTPARYPCRTIACALDLSGHGVETLRWASQFATEQGAEMHVVHAIDVEEESTNRGVLEVRRYLCERALELWRSLADQVGFKGPLSIAYGSVGTAVRRAAHDLQADVIVIGRGHIQETLGRLRTNSYAIIRESPCPVISV